MCIMYNNDLSNHNNLTNMIWKYSSILYIPDFITYDIHYHTPQKYIQMTTLSILRWTKITSFYLIKILSVNLTWRNIQIKPVVLIPWSSSWQFLSFQNHIFVMLITSSVRQWYDRVKYLHGFTGWAKVTPCVVFL